MNAGYRLLRSSIPAPRRLIRVAAWSAVECLPALVSGVAVAHAVDALTAGRPSAATLWLGAIAAAMVVGAAATRRLYAAMSPLVEDLRDGLMTATVRGTLAECARTGRPGAATVTQTIEQVDQVRNLVSAVLRSFRSTVVPLASACVGLLLLDHRLGLAVIIPLAAALALQSLLVPRTVRRQRLAALAQEAFGADTAAVLADLPALRGLGADTWGRERLLSGADAVAAAELRVVRTTALRQAVIALGAHVPLLSVLLVSLPLLRDGSLSAGAVVGATTYVLTVLAPAVSSFVAVSGGWVVELVVLLDRLALVAGRPGPESHSARTPSQPTQGYAVELRDVTFAYRPESRPVLTGLDLRVRRGEHVAVLGASGTGKSTLARLLAGLEAPTSGTVHAAEGLCFVPQEAYVFAGTLRENLLHLDPTVAEARLREALAVFGLDDLADRLGGLDGEIRSHDERLTAADRQRVVLARAWLSPAAVVVLDEATSLLPLSDDEAVEAAFTVDGRTLVTIAHRVDVAGRAGTVVFFDGADVHTGRHAELLDTHPAYRDLHRHAALYAH